MPQKQELLAQRVATAESQAELEPHLHAPPVQASERCSLQAGLQTAVNTKNFVSDVVLRKHIIFKLDITISKPF